MVDKNLFLYDLAVVAIFKDEARYLKEWLDYHLLAGVEHFYLYNNDSSDDFTEVLAPYVEENLVTLIDWSGKLMQYPAYNDAVEKFRFECRYMMFIDIDEFIFPKSTRSITEVADEILARNPNAASLAINWQVFGSNGQIDADYSRGVLERFTRRAPSNWILIDERGIKEGNNIVKSINNPRLIRHIFHPHFANHFNSKFAVNSDGKHVPGWSNEPVLADKIVVNHYYTKSAEEYRKTKLQRGYANEARSPYGDKNFSKYDRNEVFDDDILKYRAARAKNFSFESDGDRINRVVDSLVQTLTKNFYAESLDGKLETFLTCRAVAEKFQIKIGEHSAEEIALARIHQILSEGTALIYHDMQLLIDVLPEILSRPFPLAKKISQIVAQKALPAMMNAVKKSSAWIEYKNLRSLQRLLESIQ
ncbi:MAG: glycosyltransferase family 92 protein [Selenomonadaceae bacterium]|nr:glycosyltransferase family 92 protein [Selenomonadaceae bacterium]